MVIRLLKCHIETAAQADRQLVLFDLNSSEIHDSDQQRLRSWAAEIRSNPDTQALVVGRASRTPSGWKFNYDLSVARARSVAQTLIREGVPSDNVQVLGIGLQSPQIDTWIASRYGHQDEFERFGELALNQSAVVVLY